MDSTGAEIKDVIDAPNQEEAQATIRQMGYFVTKIAVKKQKKAAADKAKAGRKRGFAIGGVNSKVLCAFTRQLSILQDAGLPILRSLRILEQQSKPGRFKNSLMDVCDEIEGGSTLSEGMAKCPKAFNRLYVNMIKAGEAGGALEVILQRLAEFQERSQSLKRKIKGAMIYPVCIVSAAVVVTLVLLIWVIPVFADVFKSFGAELPAPTQFVINLSNFLVANIWYLMAIPPAAIFAVRAAYRTESGQYRIDGLLLKIPIFGLLMRKAAIARVTRTLSTLISSGVPILDALTITSRTAGNKVVERAITNARLSISGGRTIAEPLTESKVFPPMVCQMISVGETTGALDAMLGKIADFYDSEVDQTVNNMMALMEPMVILFLGVVIGGLVVAMYLPIFKLGSVIQ
jgi:type IV pilus assembly protein PilC